MKVKNPARHYPHYCIRVYFADGTLLNKRGSAQPSIDIPVEEGEYAAMVFECLDAARTPKVTLLRVDGAWVDFNAETLNDLRYPPKPDREPVPEPVPASEEELQCYEKQNKKIKEESKPEPKPEPKPAVRKFHVPSLRPQKGSDRELTTKLGMRVEVGADKNTDNK